jgi:hypothetical protein
MMTNTLPEMIDNYADALANYRVAVRTGASEERIGWLRSEIRRWGWAIRDLGLNVQYDDNNN